MMRYLTPVFLLVLANIFMTFAWYGHLKLKEYDWAQSLNLFQLVLISWGIAFFEYCIQVPANRLGYLGMNAPYTLLQLKMIQEVITLSVFFLFSYLFFKNTNIGVNQIISALLLLGAVYFAFKK